MDTHARTCTHTLIVEFVNTKHHRRQKQGHEQTENENKLMHKHTNTASDLHRRPTESFWLGEMWVTWLDYRQDTIETGWEVLACNLALLLYPPAVHYTGEETTGEQAHINKFLLWKYFIW